MSGIGGSNPFLQLGKLTTSSVIANSPDQNSNLQRAFAATVDGEKIAGPVHWSKTPVVGYTLGDGKCGHCCRLQNLTRINNDAIDGLF